MRNLKKILAVITVVAMLATLSVVPALAAGFTYETEAETLNELKLMEGMNLGDPVTRIVGLTLAIKAAGLKDEVDAMTDEEVAEILENVVDADELPAWSLKWTAYAVKEGYTSGTDATIAPKVKFSAEQTASSNEVLYWVLKIGMGYEDVVPGTASTDAINAGALSLAQAIDFGTEKNPITRDDVAGILYQACESGVNADGVSFIQSLIDAEFITEADAVAAGFVDATPDEFEIESATALNMVQVEVAFNQEVDADSAKDKDNYDIDKVAIKDASLLDDGQTVILTFEADDAKGQQDKIDLTVEGVKTAGGEAIAKTVIEDIEFIDTEIPSVVDAEVVGNDTIKVIFSEPMDPDTVKKGNFSVNSGKLYIKDVELQKNYTEALVELYSTLKDGEVTIQVKSGNEDFAGFGVIGKLLTLSVVEDNDAPVVVGYEKASKGEITLIWDEDIEFNGSVNKDDYYHTNSKNAAKDNDSVEIDGNKLTIKFNAEDNPMPEIAYVYVLKEAVKDRWDNENAQQMIKIEYEADEEPPVVEEIEVKAQDQIIIKFNEALKEDTAKDKKNYTILDDDGEEVKNIIDTPIKYSDKKVTMDFEDDLNGDYSIVIENVEDTSNNKIEKVTIPFTVDDKARPNPDDFKAKVYNAGKVDQMLKVTFGEAMATDGKYSVTDLEKYSIGSTILADIEDIELVVVDDGKAVEITIPSEKDLIEDGVDKAADRKSGENYLDIVADINLWVTRVADAAGNYMIAAEYPVNIDASGEIAIDKAEATARDTLVITLKDKLHDFEVEDLLITKLATITDSDGDLLEDLDALGYAEVDTDLNSDGNTVITITVVDDDKFDYDMATKVYVYVVDDESENVYGETLAVDFDTKYEIKDKIAPELYDDGDDDDDEAVVKDYLNWADDSTFEIIFSEKMAISSKERAGNDFVVTADGDALVNGIDFEVIGLATTNESDDTIRFQLLGDYVGFDGDLEIATAEKINYVKDANDNKIAEFEIDDFEVEMYAQPESVKRTTGDAIEITMSEKLDGSEGDAGSFAVKVNGTVVTVTDVTIDGEKVSLTIQEGGIVAGDDLEVTYTPSTAEINKNLIDKADVDVPGFSVDNL